MNCFGRHVIFSSQRDVRHAQAPQRCSQAAEETLRVRKTQTSREPSSSDAPAQLAQTCLQGAQETLRVLCRQTSWESSSSDAPAQFAQDIETALDRSAAMGSDAQTLRTSASRSRRVDAFAARARRSATQDGPGAREAAPHRVRSELSWHLTRVSERPGESTFATARCGQASCTWPEGKAIHHERWSSLFGAEERP